MSRVFQLRDPKANVQSKLVYCLIIELLGVISATTSLGENHVFLIKDLDLFSKIGMLGDASLPVMEGFRQYPRQDFVTRN